MATYRDYPVGVAQQKVLDALGLQATGFQDADRKFSDLGIVVTSKRVGRTTEPVVRLVGGGSGWSGGYGEHEEGDDYTPVSRNVAATLAQWIQ